MAEEAGGRPNLMPPPANDEWSLRHKRRKKAFGLRIFMESLWAWRRSGDHYWEYLSWHETERGRRDAIDRANRTKRVIAMMKVDR